jgi:hypothetical protein
MFGNERERTTRKIQRKQTGRAEHSWQHTGRVFVAGREQLADMLHLSIEALVGYIDAPHIGIRASVTENIHQLEGLPKSTRRRQQFL